MAETIDNIVSQEVFNQLKSLSDSINQCDESLRNCISSANEMSRSLSSASGLKDVSKAYQDAISSANGLAAAQNKYVSTVNEVRNVTSGVSDGITKMSTAYRSSNEVMNEMGANQMASARSMVAMTVELKQVQEEISKLSKSYDGGRISVESYKSQMSDLKQTEAELKAATAEHAAMLRSTTAESVAAEGSYNQMRARISELSQALKSMSDDERNNQQVGGIMRAELVQLQRQMKELNREMNGSGAPKFRTQIMNAKNDMMQLGETMKSLKGDLDVQKEKAEEIAEAKGKESDEYKMAKSAIEEGEKALKDMSAQYDVMMEKTANLVREQRAVNKQMTALADPLANIKAMSQGVGLAAHSFTLMKTASRLAGIENEAVEKTMAKVYLVQQSLNAVTQIATTLNRNSVLMLKLKATWTKMQAAYQAALTKSTKAHSTAEAVNTVQMKRNTVATKGATVATGALATGEGVATTTSWTLTGALKAVSVAIKSIPVIGWILAIISALTALIRLIASSNDEEERGLETKKKLFEAETERREKMTQIKMETQQHNKELHKSVEIINSAAEGTKVYDDAIQNVSNSIGVSIEYLKSLSKETQHQLADMASAAEEAKKKVDASNSEYLDKAAKARTLEDEIRRIEGHEYKVRKEMYENLGKKYGIAGDKLNEISHNNRGSVEHLISSAKEMAGLTEDTLVLLEAHTRELEKQADAEEIKLSLIQEEEKRWKDVESAKEKIKEIDKQGMSAAGKHKEDLKDIREQLNGMANDFLISKNAANMSEEALVEFLSSGIQKSEEKAEQGKKIVEWYNKSVAAANKAYYKEQETAAKAHADAKSDLLIAELQFELSQSKDYREKIELNEKIEAEKLEKDLRAIKADQVLSEEEKNRKIELLKKQMQANVSKYSKDTERAVLENSLKAATELADALASLDEAMLRQLDADGEEYKELAIKIENDKSNQILKDLALNLNKQLDAAEENGEDTLDTYKKYDTQVEIEKMRHNKALSDINEKSFSERLKTLKEELEYEKNGMIVGKGGKLNSDEEYELKKKGIQEQIDLYKEKANAGEEIAAIDHEIMKLESDMTLLEEENAERRAKAHEEEVKSRVKALQELGSAFIGLGNVMADGIEDEVQRTKVQQALSVAQVLMNQGVAIAEAVKEGMKGNPYTAAIRVAASVAAIMASMVQAVNAVNSAKNSIQEAESYAEGTDYHRGGAAIVGEAGYPELVMSNGKSFVVDAPTFFPNLPVGSKVVPLVGNTGADLSEVISLMGDLKRKETVQVNVGKDVYSYIWSGAGRTRILNKKFMH